jgi:hypothetical protein
LPPTSEVQIMRKGTKLLPSSDDFRPFQWFPLPRKSWFVALISR